MPHWTLLWLLRAQPTHLPVTTPGPPPNRGHSPVFLGQTLLTFPASTPKPYLPLTLSCSPNMRLPPYPHQLTSSPASTHLTYLTLSHLITRFGSLHLPHPHLDSSSHLPHLTSLSTPNSPHLNLRTYLNKPDLQIQKDSASSLYLALFPRHPPHPLSAP